MNRITRSIPRFDTRAAATAIAGSAALALSAPASAQLYLPDGPEEFQGVDIIEHRGDPLPLETPLTTADGREVTLGDYFDGEKPVVLVLAYYTCPMQCQLVLNSSLDVFKKLDWDLGDEYRALTISFDPRDTGEGAMEWQTDLHRGYKRPIESGGWDFFTATEEDSKAICDAVGFGYKFIPSAGDYSHPSAIFVIEPNGNVSNYLYGVHYLPDQLTLALQDAGDGKVGSLYDRMIFRCFLYDADSNSYVADAMLIMRISGGLTVLLLGGGVGLMLWRSRQENLRSSAESKSNAHHPATA